LSLRRRGHNKEDKDLKGLWLKYFSKSIKETTDSRTPDKHKKNQNKNHIQIA
jgi:hypothetical protein